jgi:hypothetical protein
METSLNTWQPVVTDPGTAIAVRPGEQAKVELKLLAPQGTLEKLREMPVILQHARNRGSFRRLETVYYDTPERLLFQRGMSLRVRRNGKHFLQTLKLPTNGQPLARRQWEAPIDSANPDLAQLRYAAEFFLPLYATHAPAKRYVKRLARLQVSLGRARDIATTRILLDAIRQDDQPALRLAIGAVAGWQARDQIAVAKTLRKRWRRFKATPSFWRR